MAVIGPVFVMLFGMGSAINPCANATTPTSGGSNDLGAVPVISSSPGTAVRGRILLGAANIRTRAGLVPGARAMAVARPDFITLNEVGDVPLRELGSAASGYDAFRENAADPTPGGEQSLNNAILYRNDTWTLREGGRMKIVDDDHVIFRGGQRRLWDRYATWAIFERADGAVVPVVAVHHMTNAYRYPRQWGNPPMTRAQQYGLGMDHLHNLVDTLSRYGPVLIGGDMNSHPGDGPNSAANKMQQAGYSYTKGSGVMYTFHAAPVTVVRTWQISEAQVHSDHPGLFTSFAMNRAAPAGAANPDAPAPSGATNTDCVCPTDSTQTTPGSTDTVVTAAFNSSNAAPNLDARAQAAARAASAAGFRGEDLVIAVAVARVESTWNPTARNGRHFGLWQISREHRGKVPGWVSDDDIFDRELNARYAFELYSARPGSGPAKFADWLPFQGSDYRDHLTQARAAVAAATGTVPDSQECGTDHVVDRDMSRAVQARIDAMLATPQGLCSLSWTSGAPCTYYNQCPKVVDALYGGPGVGRGYGNGQDVAQGIIDRGLAQSHGTGLSPLPPVGAVVSWRNGNGVGHVAVYVGDGKIFGNDYGCTQRSGYGCVGYADVRAPSGAVTWALPKTAFDLGGMPSAAA